MINVLDDKRCRFLKNNNMKLIDEEKLKELKKNSSRSLILGVDLCSTIYEIELQNILLELIESIFDYEKESGSKIIEFDRTPESVLETYIKNKKNGITPPKNP